MLTTVATSGELGAASRGLRTTSARGLVADGVEDGRGLHVDRPGVDMARLAREHDVDLLLVDAPDGLLEDARVLACSTRPRATSASSSGRPSGDGPVLVPFAGAEHDWAAVELGAWLARAPARDAAARRRGDGRRRARREPATRQRVDRRAARARRPRRAAARRSRPGGARRGRGGAGIVVVGLTDRWRREASAAPARRSPPSRRRRRSSSAAASARAASRRASSETRFTWTIAG